MISILMCLLAGLSGDNAPPPKTPADKPGELKLLSPDDLLKEHRERLLIEEQKMRQFVEDGVRKIKRDLANDPDGVLDALKNTLNRVKDHPDLPNTARDQMVAQLQTALREAAARTPAIKLKAAEANVEKVQMEMKVAVAIAKATSIHPKNPKKAMNLLRGALLGVWDNAKISDLQRDALMTQLIEVRGSLNRKD